MMEEATKSVELFCSYAHQDEKLWQELEKHLIILRREKFISTWDFHRLHPDRKRVKEVDVHLNTADIILLLISPDFMASDYCYNIEMKRAMERYESGEAWVIPILLRKVMWDEAPFSKLKVLPTKGKPVTEWRNRDRAFYDVATEIKIVVERIRNEPLFENKKSYLYDFVLSYAREDRFYAETLANALRLRGVEIFCYSQYMNPEKRLAMWGKNLNTSLANIYEKQARYCILFLSRHYLTKKWTNHELEVALVRMLEEEEYIFPILLDETEIPNILIDTFRIKWHEYTVEEIADALAEKLKGVGWLEPRDD